MKKTENYKELNEEDRTRTYDLNRYGFTIHRFNHSATSSREKGIEPLPLVLETNVLPLNYPLQ